MSQILHTWGAYPAKSVKDASNQILERSEKRQQYYSLCIKMLTITKERKIRLIMENPHGNHSFLRNCFVTQPTIIDSNRSLRGDEFVKPTAYWFINCTNTIGYSLQPRTPKRVKKDSKGCEERSMISPDYARNFICDFILGKEQSMTSVDPPEVIKFVRKEYPDVKLHPPKQSIYKYAIEKQLLPSMRVRWCCAELKEQAGAGKVTLIGIRKAESSRRAKRNEVEVSNHKFSGDLDSFEKWQYEKINKKLKHLNQDQFSENKEHSIRCINGKDSIIVSPILYWTEKDVWRFLNENNIPHCSLYDKGYKRIGCILCPMSQKKQKIREMEDFPHVKRNWIRAIKKIRGGGICKHQYFNRQQMQDTLHIRTQTIGSAEQRDMGGFSSCSSSDRLTDEQENEIAENIFDWWISGVSYKKWYANKFKQLQLF